MNRKENQEARAVLDTRLTVLVDSEPGIQAVAKALPHADGLSHIRVLHECSGAAANAENLLVFSAASTLDRVSECVSLANKAHRLAAVLVYIDVAADWLPYVFHQSGLRTLRNMIVHSDRDLPTRILNAWAIGGEHDFIADAAVIKDRLVVRSCAFKEYTMSFEAFPALRAIPQSERSNFVLQDDGLLLHWPECDVHLDIDDIRFANDPRRQQLARLLRIDSQRAIGAALRRLRDEAGLKQSNIRGISERQVRRVEAGDPLTLDTLDAYASAMHIHPDQLLEKLGEIAGQPSNEQELVNSERTSTTPQFKNLTYDRSAWPSAKLAEGLKLAAESAQVSSVRNWNLDVPGGGSVSGVLEHDFRNDELAFVINEAQDIGADVKPVSIVVWSSDLEPLVSKPFVAKVGVRVSLGVGRGILPGEVSKIELRAVDES